ncbi:uncharacterized protein EAF02_000258 [Botrytis sinoallii]|uniref:uncharacterized protein n=1 Tax=Botrytis sinoallii TaxID=1463999 RepID=UPI00190049EB|nr:uncharacterized protein EAF02_000258 [Botrytis sinoallii]KAF7892720.1 hypothetical protein EAF02_000258 [Botrytis sinoallii]
MARQSSRAECVGKTAGQDVSEDATSRKKKEEEEELGKNQDVPAQEEVSTEEGSPVATPDPLTEVSETSESDGRIKDARAEESRREREDIARAKRGKGREITDEMKAREIEEKLNRNAAQKARFDVRGLGAPSGAADIPDPRAPDPRPPPGARPGTAEKKFYVYKAPHKVSYIKPWTWRFRRAKSADEKEM